MQQEDNLIFTAYNVNGAKAFSEEKYYSAGYHEIELKAGDVHADRLLFYTLQNENEIIGGKMLVLKE